ncbi:hypothetical protein GCM10010508_17420 [Streptomyces naganishii JCM 4654]|uniref:Uncharacterized protein n=1 Tax=Streptomyces naganishii JCM 4654 TaxID=1306179 RepID=A0A919CUJ7_9ACTN|nr:hypothetical protein GCM10010508_17420 [Streptomyces naganishii JCM 4654]
MQDVLAVAVRIALALPFRQQVAGAQVRGEAFGDQVGRAAGGQAAPDDVFHLADEKAEPAGHLGTCGGRGSGHAGSLR